MNERSSHHPHGGPPDGWDPEASELADPPRIVVAGDGVECEASSVHFSNPADRAATAFRETLELLAEIFPEIPRLEGDDRVSFYRERWLEIVRREIGGHGIDAAEVLPTRWRLVKT